MANNNYANPFTQQGSNFGTSSYVPQSSYSTYPQQANQSVMNMLNSMNNNQQQNQSSQTPQFDPTQYVTKEDYESLLNEKRQLQEKLESELAQRVDIEFFKMEQEMMLLPEGARLAQELDYQKNLFFDTFWRSSEPGKAALLNYRENIQVLYDQYRISSSNKSQPINTAPLEEEAF